MYPQSLVFPGCADEFCRGCHTHVLGRASEGFRLALRLICPFVNQNIRVENHMILSKSGGGILQAKLPWARHEARIPLSHCCGKKLLSSLCCVSLEGHLKTPDAPKPPLLLICFTFYPQLPGP